MSNISSAHGYIVIDYDLCVNGQYAVKSFLKLLAKTTDYTQYDTSIDLTDSLALFEESLQEEYDLTIEFQGTGRWSYLHNVKILFEMLGWVASEYHFESEYYTMLNYFIKSEIPIEFKFVDIEEGCELYYGAIIEVLPYFSDKYKIMTTTKERGESWER